MDKQNFKVRIQIIFLICMIFTGLFLIQSYLFAQKSDKFPKNNRITESSLSQSDIPQTNTYSIQASEDDAWNRQSPQPLTDYTSVTLILGGSTSYLNAAHRRICLRWNISIPQGAYIHSAYINLTPDATYFNDFRVRIHAFTTSSVAPFNVTSENVYNRPKTANPSTVLWDITNVSANIDVQSPDISSLVQSIVNRGDWTGTGYFGLLINPYLYVALNEYFYFYSYDASTPAYYPKLVIEWELYPYFSEVPTQTTIANDTAGYFLSWTAVDPFPTTYNITRNGFQVQNGTWQSGIPIIHPIPPLSVGIYNYTILVYDANGTCEVDSLNLTVVASGFTAISDIQFLQNSSITTYFQTGAGPFTLELYNSSPLSSVEVSLVGYYPNYNLSMSVDIGIPVSGGLSPYSYYSLTYDTSSGIIYNDSKGCFQLTPPDTDQYTWVLVILLPLAYYYKNVTSVEAGVWNMFSISVNSGESFLYNGEIYSTLTMGVLNVDLTPPSFSIPEILQPHDLSTNLEVRINVTDNLFGSGIADVTLFYSVNNGPWQSIEMLDYNGLYYVGIPPQKAGASIQYYIRMTDYNGNMNQTAIYTTYSPNISIDPIVWALIGILASTIAIIWVFRDFWRRNEPSTGISEKSQGKLDMGEELQ